MRLYANVIRSFVDGLFYSSKVSRRRKSTFSSFSNPTRVSDKP